MRWVAHRAGNSIAKSLAGPTASARDFVIPPYHAALFYSPLIRLLPPILRKASLQNFEGGPSVLPLDTLHDVLGVTLACLDLVEGS